MGNTFEFTPAGIREHGPEGAAVNTGVVSAAQAVADLREQVAKQEAARAPTVRVGDSAMVATKPLPSAPLKRRHFVKELRARLRVVERQIKLLRDLEEEASEIRRLIAAAKAPPAKVTAINTRKSG